MALFSSGVPSSLSLKQQQQQQILKLSKPLSQTKFHISVSPISRIPKIPLLLHISCATQQQHFSSSTSTLPDPTSESQPQKQEQKQELNPNRTRLIAQNLPWTSTLDDIRSLFENYGTVVDAELSMYNKTKNRGLAFVEMASEEEALAAVSNLDSYELEGRVIKVEFAKALKKKPSQTTESMKKFTVFVGNLTWRVRSSDLRELFGDENASVVAAEVVFQSNPRRSAGYGFVSFRSKEEADAAIAAFNRKILKGRAVRLSFSKKDVSGVQGDSQESGETVQVNGDERLSNQPDDKEKEVTNEAE